MIPAYENFEASLVKFLTFEVRDDPNEMSRIRKALREKYDYLVKRLNQEAIFAKDPDLTLGFFHDTGGYQLIAEGACSDRAKQYDVGKYNFHLQNTSQWVWAFGLVFDKESHELSVHT